ncbi:MAG TPA: peptidylprolyl isomerase [Humisphaera sp.]
MTTRTRRPASAPVRRAATVVADALEPRRLFAATVVQPIPATAGDPSGPTTTIDLTPFLNDPATAVARFTTSLGDVRYRLYASQKPNTVANFLKYVTSNRYNATFVHRSDTLDPSDPITTAPEILQLGGYAYPGFAHITTDAPIKNEYDTNGVLQNARGTIAMAKTSNPDSATSEFFVNVKDTSYALNNTANSGGFTVFGKVFDDDLDVVDAIAAVQQRGFASPFTNLPLRNYTDADYQNQVVPTDNNLVMVTSAVQLPDVTYSASSSDPSLVTAAIDGRNLVLNYGATRGTATITVTATDLDGGTATTTFTAGVGQLDVTLGGDSGNKQLTYTDADGTATTVALKGAGTASVRLVGTGLTQSTAKGRVTAAGVGAAELVSVTGSDGTTSLSISSKGGDKATTVGTLNVDGAIKSIAAKGVAVTESLTVGGAAGSVALGTAAGATVSLGGTAADAGASVSFAGDVTDTDMTFGSPVKSLKLRGVLDGNAGGDDTITANNGIDSLSTSGNLAADVSAGAEGTLKSVKVGGTLTGDLTAHQIGSVSAKGGITGSTITATHGASEAADPNAKADQGVQSIKTGAMSGVVVNSAGTIGSISASSIVGGRIVAGATSLTTLPTTLAELVEPAAILSLKSKSTGNVVVAARNLGKISVGTLATANAGTPFGFAADVITSLSGKTDGGQKFAVKNAADQSNADAALAGVSLGDAVVRVL